MGSKDISCETKETMVAFGARGGCLCASSSAAKNPGPNLIAYRWRKISLGTDGVMLSVPVAYAGSYPSSRRYLYTVGLLRPHSQAYSLILSFPVTYSG